MRAPAGLLVFACAFVVSGCNGHDDATTGAEPARQLGAEHEYKFVLSGPRPWNHTVYMAIGDAERDGGHILDEDQTFVVTAREGQTWDLHSEPDATPAEDAMFWTIRANGTFGDERTIPIDAPSRAELHVETVLSHGGPDQVVLYVEETGVAGCAILDPRSALTIAAWNADGGNSYRHKAPPRPWTLDDFAPGECVVAVRTRGRQWTATRADLSPGGRAMVNASQAPKGGGTVVCDDPQALLVLDVGLMFPAPRLTVTFQYESRWEGVPPGTRTLRLSDGTEREVTVIDGELARVGRAE